MLDRLDAIVPEPVPSPLKKLEAADRQRKRAVSKKVSKPKQGDTPTGWTWGDDGAVDDAHLSPAGSPESM